MTAPLSTKSYTWDGPFEVVTLKLPSGRSVTVSRGDTVDALPSEADALDATPGWVETPPTKPNVAAKPVEQAKQEVAK